MGFASAILPVLAGGILGSTALKALAPKPSAPAVAAPLPSASVRTNSVVSDALSRRTGSAANMRTGAMGAEAGTSAKKQLMGT